MQVQAGFSKTPAVRRNNINLLSLFLSRWLYATPLDLEALLKHLAAGPPEEKGALDRRQFGMQLLILGARTDMFLGSTAQQQVAVRFSR